MKTARLRLELGHDWSNWGQKPVAPWSVRVSEDVMVVHPQRGVLTALPPARPPALGPLLDNHAKRQFDGAVMTLTTGLRETVAEAVAEVSLLRSELIRTLDTDYGLAPMAAGLHPWSQTSSPSALESLRPRPQADVTGILGKFDPLCGLRISVAVPHPDAAVRALDGLRLHMPLLLALAANSPFWRGRSTGLASTRTALHASTCHAELPRSFGSYAAYRAALDVLVDSRAIARAQAVDWDARLLPDIGAVELTVMDSQSRADEIAGLAALAQCLVRMYAGRGHIDDSLPELLLANRSAAVRSGVRAQVIDPAGHFAHSALHELSRVVAACASPARELDCSRELARAERNATDPGDARQRSIAATAGLTGLVTGLIGEFAAAHLVAV